MLGRWVGQTSVIGLHLYNITYTDRTKIRTKSSGEQMKENLGYQSVFILGRRIIC
jgi:hypothetical protein